MLGMCVPDQRGKFAEKLTLRETFSEKIFQFLTQKREKADP